MEGSSIAVRVEVCGETYFDERLAEGVNAYDGI